MEISHDFLIDLALNIGGYLLAGALSIVLYSLVSRKKTVAGTEPVVTETIPTTPEEAEPPHEKRRVEFIRLGDRAPERSRPQTPPSEPAGRRDRAEIIRIARSMLKAGATNDRIKSVLPISESELALLDMSKS